MRTPSANTKPENALKQVIAATSKLWRSHHLTYNQARYVAKEVRRVLALQRPKERKRVVARLSREETRLISHAYRMKGERGLLIKTLFQAGARVSEFVNIHTQYSPRRIQQIIKGTAAEATITKRVYPHLLRHSVATTRLEQGMPIEQIQKFLGHSTLETTQISAESTTEMIKESYQRALGE